MFASRAVRSRRWAGLGYGWHDHDFELLAPPDGTRPIEHLADASGEIGLELDLAWIHVAGKGRDDDELSPV